MSRIIVDPVTRIEGHLKITTEVEAGRIVAAYSSGEMFRGFEQILAGRDPLDAPVITQRICGVCPVSHALASTACLEAALGLKVPRNGELLKNLLLGANYLQSHILHFYQLCALDFIDVKEILGYNGPDARLLDLKRWVEGELQSNRILPAAPFLPRLEGQYPTGNPWNMRLLTHYLDALEARRKAHAMLAMFAGKIPHMAAVVPGGVTSQVDAGDVEAFRGYLRGLRQFVDQVYLPDVLATLQRFPQYLEVGRGVQRYLSYGLFPLDGRSWLPGGVVENGQYAPVDLGKIGEQVDYSYFNTGSGGHPHAGTTTPEPQKNKAYSWLKAPRYGGKAFEVGPLARVLVAYANNQGTIKDNLDALLRQAGIRLPQLSSVAGRHLARAFEAVEVAAQMDTMLDQLSPGAPTVAIYRPAVAGTGVGVCEAPRGALGHWVRIENGRIAHYQCVVPSTWNFSPRGQAKDPGPVEAALLGTAVTPAEKGLEVARIVRSFDPCIACAVH